MKCKASIDTIENPYHGLRSRYLKHVESCAYLITDSYAHVVLTLGNQNLDGWQFFVCPVGLYCCPHRVLEELEEDVIKVRRRVAEGQRHLLAFFVQHFYLA